MTNNNDILHFEHEWFNTLAKRFIEENVTEWNAFLVEEFAEHKTTKQHIYKETYEDGSAYYFC